MSEQNLQKVKSYNDLTAKQVVRYKFNPEDEWQYAIVNAISQEVLASCIRETNRITLTDLLPPGTNSCGVTDFGPVNPKDAKGKGAFRLEDTDMELVPRERVRGYRVSYSDEVL